MKIQQTEDLKAMILADLTHLAEALNKGNRTHAHQFVDAIIDNKRELEDLVQNQQDFPYSS